MRIDDDMVDVVVVGTGNAAFCAAHAARDHGARVLMLEKGSEDWIGGNSYFTAGAFRIAFDSQDDLVALLADPSDERLPRTDVPPYPAPAFLADLERLTLGRTDPVLAKILVEDSLDTVRWLRGHGIRFHLQYHRQAYEVNGRFQFWGDLPLGTMGGGEGLIEQHRAAAETRGVEIRFDSPVVGLLRDAFGAVTGVVVDGPNGREEIRARAVVLACGGFEADPRLRAAHLGPGWDLAKVRGTPHNTGEGLMAALEFGAQAYGHWSGCHSIQWDAGAPPAGDRIITNRFSKQSYPIGIVVNVHGRRFLDEGADFRNYTYARYGAEVLKQPGALAWQIFDAKTTPLLRDYEYEIPGVSRVEAETIHDLAVAAGIDPAGLEQTVAEFNRAVQPGEFNPAIKDGKRTEGITPPKSNWAVPIDTPPFVAFAVTCGITFTFGGLRIDPQARVLGRNGQPIPGLHAAGELVGGIFYHNYPGGSGLTSGAVFGRRAGVSAAAHAAAVGNRG